MATKAAYVRTDHSTLGLLFIVAFVISACLGTSLVFGPIAASATVISTLSGLIGGVLLARGVTR